MRLGRGACPLDSSRAVLPTFALQNPPFQARLWCSLVSIMETKVFFVTNVHPCSGLRGDGTLFGYTKIQGTLNSQAYHNLLQYRVLPEVRAGNGGTLAGLTWQQDGATPHASDLNIRYLANQFGGRLLARRSEGFGGRDWAARSPDLNPLDYGTGWLFSRN